MTTQQKVILDRVSDYAKKVVDGEIIAGQPVIAACKRHLDDMVNADSRGYYFDYAAAERFFGFCEHVCCVEQEDEWRPFILEPPQIFIAGSIFGWKRKSDNKRRFRTAYIEQGKGNGKSPLAAAVGHYLLSADGELAAEVYAAAAKRDQAMILFRDAVIMYENSPALLKRLTPSGKNPIWNLAYIDTSSFFKPISADNKQSGARPHGALVDELHEHKDGSVLKMLKAGQKKRTQPLTFIITNSGSDRKSVCWDEHCYAIEVARRIKEDDEYFSYVCALDPEDDWLNDESCWIKANPLLGVTIKHDYLRKQVREAKGIGSTRNSVARLNFCVWTNSENAAIKEEVWDACLVEKVDCEDLTAKGYPCFGGLDLSQVSDLTAFTLTWLLHDKVDEWKFASKTWFFQPSEVDRGKDQAFYDGWVQSGFIENVEGARIKYGWIAEVLAELVAKYNPVTIGGDPYGVSNLLEKCDELGIVLPIETHPQGFQKRVIQKDQERNDNAKEIYLWMPDSINKLEAALLERRIEIEKSPVMDMCAFSVVYESNRTGHRMFNKEKANNKIDGMVSLAMSIGVATMIEDAPKEGVSFYSDTYESLYD